MHQLPKQKPFTTPDNYFEELPDRILSQVKDKNSSPNWYWAAAAVALLSLGWWQFGGTNSTSLPLTTEEEVLLYIESGHWSAHDVLSLAEDPNQLLDQIIEEEYAKTAPLWTEEETWF